MVPEPVVYKLGCFSYQPKVPPHKYFALLNPNCFNSSSLCADLAPPLPQAIIIIAFFDNSLERFSNSFKDILIAQGMCFLQILPDFLHQ